MKKPPLTKKAKYSRKNNLAYLDDARIRYHVPSKRVFLPFSKAQNTSTLPEDTQNAIKVLCAEYGFVLQTEIE